jgi:hypothetical protein
MSDMSTGPDGSNNFPPPPPSSQFVFQTEVRRETLSGALSVWLQVLLCAAGLFAAVAGLGGFWAAAASDDYFTNSYSSIDEWVRAEDLTETFLGLFYVSSIAVFVLLIIFLFRAHKSCETIWKGPRKWSRGWTVGAWFIPFANAIITPMVWVETDRIASARRHDGLVAEDWRKIAVKKMIVVWWSLYAVGQTLLFAFGTANGETTAIDDYAGFMRAGSIGSFLVAASCVLAALSVRRIGRALSPSAIG